MANTIWRFTPKYKIDMLHEKQSVYVRTAREHQQFNIEGKNIPVENLHNHFQIISAVP